MIRFSCHCQHPFELPDNEAGGFVQCPKCGRLNDVPLMGDLPNLTEDGTYKLEEPVPEDPTRLGDAQRVYAPGHVDEYGREIDLRGTVGGDDEDRPIDLAYESREPERLSPPKYDPVTGELIRPVEVKPDLPETQARTALPAMKRPKKRFAIEHLPHVQTLLLFGLLLRPMNLFVMAIIALIHGLYFALMIVAMFKMFFVGVLNLLCLGVILSHAVVVMEETGPACQDELPRPFRNVSLYDDIWMPFVSLMLSLFVCYTPAFGVLLSSLPTSITYPIAGMMALGGTFFFPAVLLTATTSGGIANLRPDRVLGVIKVCGVHYLVLLAAVVIATLIYGMAFIGLHMWVIDLFGWRRTQPNHWEKLPTAVPLLLLGIYLMHYMAWLFGQTYRVFQPRFPWVFQGRRADEQSEGAAAPARGFDVIPPKTARSARHPRSSGRLAR